jgi:hypothetical protein
MVAKMNGTLAGIDTYDEYSRPIGMAGMDSEQIIGSCNAAMMHFLQGGADFSGGDEWKLLGDRYSDIIRGPVAWRGWRVNR